jgi:hypothetical protein
MHGREPRTHGTDAQMKESELPCICEALPSICAPSKEDQISWYHASASQLQVPQLLIGKTVSRTSSPSLLLIHVLLPQLTTPRPGPSTYLLWVLPNRLKGGR